MKEKLVRWYPVGAFLLLLLWLSIVRVSAASIEYSGSCGENLTWTIDSDGVFTVSGQGEMDSYTYYTAQDQTDSPWDWWRTVIKKVVIEDGVTSVGKSAFWGCSNLKEVVIGDNVKTIEPNAFHTCKALETITIGDNVEAIGENAFMLCRELLSVHVSSLETWCGIQFEDVSANPAAEKAIFVAAEDSWNYIDATLYVDGVPLESELVIPDGVSLSGTYTFADYNTLTSVVIPDSVTEIGTGVFFGCENLSTITVPGTITCIGDYAFCGCGFSEIVLPEGVEKVGEGSYSGCKSVVNVILPDSLVNIGNRAFSSCPFTSIDIPAGVTSIGEYTFAYCKNLKEISLSGNLLDIGNNAFRNCISMENIEIPKSVQSIGNSAFVGCSTLEKVILHDGLAQIGESAFEELTNLSEMMLPDSVVIIGKSAFKNLANWDNARIPASVETVGAYAYSGCTKLDSIELPDSVTEIGDYAFQNCSGATCVKLSEDLSKISAYSFSGCSGLINLTVPASISKIDVCAFNNCTSLERIDFSGNAPTIADTAFSNVTATCYYPAGNETYMAEITTADFGGDLLWTYEGAVKDDSVYKCGDNVTWELTEDGVLKVIGTGAMYDYSVDNLVYAPWYESRNSVCSVQIGEGITHIGDAAFYSCTAVTSVTMPDTIVSIGDRAFQSVAVTSIDLSDSLVEIGEYAFHGTKLVSVVLPEGVTIVGDYTFSESKLKSVVLPDSLTYIPDRMFYLCHYLLDVDFPEKIVTIGNGAFGSCFGLKSVVLPEGLISIGDKAFSGCGWYSAWSSYYSCYNFKSVTLPSTLQSIGNQAFYWCESLGSINIPDNVTSIGDYTFGYCKGLKNITIPANITEIGSDAFMQCSGLSSVTFRWGAPTIALSAFSSVKATCYYPSNNPDWTSRMLQNYGGKLTWVAQEMEEPLEGSGGGSGENAGEEEGDDSGQAGGSGTGTGNGESDGGETGGTGGSSGDSSGESGNGGSGSDSGDSSGGGSGSFIAITASGTCGNSAKWQLTEGGVLTISGNGAMEDCDSYSDVPWSEYRHNIVTVVIEEGITSIGGGAFYNCSALTSIEIPDSVTSIGSSAFYDCDSLTIYGYEGSYAETYANENDIPFANISTSVTGISLSKTSTTLNVGANEILTVTISPTNAINKSVTWTSSDTSVATVDSNGLVTAVALGTATITVTTDDGGKTASCTVTVTDPAFFVNGAPCDGTLLEVIAAAEAGSVITLRKDVDLGEAGIVSSTAITLDLNGNTLTASYFVAFEGTNVIDNSVAKTGVLKAANCTFDEANTQMPVYNGVDGYVFATVVHQEQRNSEAGENTFELIFRPSLGKGEVVNNTLLANGGDVAGITIGIRLEWTVDGETKSKDLVYGDDLVKEVYSNGKAFYIKALSTNSFDNLKITPLVQSQLNTGIVSNGTEFAAN